LKPVSAYPSTYFPTYLKFGEQISTQSSDVNTGTVELFENVAIFDIVITLLCALIFIMLISTYIYRKTRCHDSLYIVLEIEMRRVV